MNYPYDNKSQMDESGEKDMENDSMMGMAMKDNDAIADDVEAFGMMSTPDNQRTVDDGADDVIEGAESDSLDPFNDPDDDGSFEVFDDLGPTNLDLDFSDLK